MQNRLKTKELVLTALLIALGIVIPVCFSFLRVVLPPAFTATLMAHVPVFIAMFISPFSALFTALGTAIGFFFTSDPVVAARAASHVVFALVGAFMIKKRCNLILAGVVTALLHALCEALVVLLFLGMGWTENKTGAPIVAIAFYTTGVGTLIHDAIDYVIACGVGFALVKAKAIPPIPHLWKNGE